MIIYKNTKRDRLRKAYNNWKTIRVRYKTYNSSYDKYVFDIFNILHEFWFLEVE